MPVPRLFGLPLAFAAALAIAGCGSIGTQIPTSVGGLPPDAPAPAPVQAAFPDVYDIPPPRPTKLMSEQERAGIAAELAAIRTKVNAQSNELEKERTGDRR